MLLCGRWLNETIMKNVYASAFLLNVYLKYQ